MRSEDEADLPSHRYPANLAKRASTPPPTAQKDRSPTSQQSSKTRGPSASTVRAGTDNHATAPMPPKQAGTVTAEWPLISADGVVPVSNQVAVAERRQSADDLTNLCPATTSAASISTTESCDDGSGGRRSSSGRPSWASIASKPGAPHSNSNGRQAPFTATTSLQTSRTSSPHRHTRSSVSLMLGGRTTHRRKDASHPPSAAATNAANASSPDLAFLTTANPHDHQDPGPVFNDDDPPLPSLPPLNTGSDPDSAASLTSALVSPPLPPHPHPHAAGSSVPLSPDQALHAQATKKTWANVAGAARPTAVVKPQLATDASPPSPPHSHHQPPLHQPTEEIPADSDPSPLTPPPEEPQPTTPAELHKANETPVAIVLPVELPASPLTILAEQPQPQPQEEPQEPQEESQEEPRAAASATGVEFAFSGSEGSGTEDEEAAVPQLGGLSFGNFADLNLGNSGPGLLGGDATRPSAGGISFGDFGGLAEEVEREEAAAEEEGESAEALPNPGQSMAAFLAGLERLSLANGSSQPSKNANFAAQLARHFHTAVADDPKVIVYSEGKLLRKSAPK